MGKGHLDKLKNKIRLYIFSLVFLGGVGLIAASQILALGPSSLSTTQIVLMMTVFWLVISMALAFDITGYVLQPFINVARAILHVSPKQHLVTAPDMDNIKLGRDIVTNLIRQVYDFASSNPDMGLPPGDTNNDLPILDQIPLSILKIDSDKKIIYSNSFAKKYFEGLDLRANQTGLEQLDLFYGNDEIGLSEWIDSMKGRRASAERTWDRVRLDSKDEAKKKFFDISARFSQLSDGSFETIVAVFDHTDTYVTDDQSISFLALAVHELRQPLTLMRGYVEVFEEDLSHVDKPAEVSNYLQKMRASAEGLTSIISNILNVARFEQQQLRIKFGKEDWGQILERVLVDMRLRAAVHGIKIDLQVEKDLPKVAVDASIISEVVTNLLGNAIKYSPDSNRILVKAYVSKSGLVETSVRDWGVGIPSSVMPHLFEKFYRNHQTKGSIGGSGLGLYLSKAIVQAHHGHIWAKANKDEGSTFGFSILPFSKFDQNQTSTYSNTIIHQRHGWIKNHLLSRQ